MEIGYRGDVFLLDRTGLLMSRRMTDRIVVSGLTPLFVRQAEVRSNDDGETTEVEDHYVFALLPLGVGYSELEISLLHLPLVKFQVQQVEGDPGDIYHCIPGEILHTGIMHRPCCDQANLNFATLLPRVWQPGDLVPVVTPATEFYDKIVRERKDTQMIACRQSAGMPKTHGRYDMAFYPNTRIIS